MYKYLVIYYKGHDIGRHILNVGIIPEAKDSKDARSIARERFGKPPKGSDVCFMRIEGFNHPWMFLL